MADQTAQLMLTLDPGPEEDERELAGLTWQLRAGLPDLAVEAVDPVRTGEIPEGAKVSDPITLGGGPAFVTGRGFVVLTALIQAWFTWHRQSSPTAGSVMTC